jgi:hypothetical protein
MKRFLLPLFAALCVTSASPAAGPPEGFAPVDAAIFAHLDFVTLWKSPLGEQFRTLKADEVVKFQATAEKTLGVKFDDILNVTVFLPNLKGGEDFSTIGWRAEVKTMPDKKLIEAALKESKLEYAWDGETLLTELPTARFAPVNNGKEAPKAKALKDRPRSELIVVDFSQGKVVTLFSKMPDKLRKLQEVVAGPQSKAFAAAKTKVFAMGINFGNFPDEVRSPDLPAEVRPFAPLLKSDAVTITGEFVDGSLALEGRFQSGDKIVLRDAERSLGALQGLLGSLLQIGQSSLAKSKDEKEKAALPLVVAGIESINKAKIRTEADEAVVSLAMKTDLPFASVLAKQFSGDPANRSGSRNVAQNNLKQLALAMHNYEGSYGHFPPAAIVGKKGKPQLSWRVMVLPYIEQEALYKKFKLDEAWDSEHNMKVFNENPMPKVFALPGVSAEGSKETYFRVFVGNGAAFDNLKTMTISNFTDGTSNTILIATAATSVPWSKPEEIGFDPKTDVKKLLMLDKDGCNVCLADGSVRFFSPKLSEITLKALITRGGGEVVNFDE